MGYLNVNKIGGKTLVIALVIFLFLGNFFQYYLSNKQNDKCMEIIQSMKQEAEKSAANRDFENFEMKNDIRTFLQNDGLKFPVDILVDELGGKTSIPLRQLLHRETLVVRISQANCMTCLDAILPLLSHLKKENILLLADYTNARFLKKMVENHHLSFPCYRIKRLPDLPIEKLGVPYLFLLDKDGEMHSLYIPHKEMLDEVEQCLEIMVSRLP